METTFNDTRRGQHQRPRTKCNNPAVPTSMRQHNLIANLQNDSSNGNPTTQTRLELASTTTSHLQLSPTEFYLNPLRMNKFFALTLLAILTIVITYLPFQESIIILCDSDNHHQQQQQQSKPTATRGAAGQQAGKQFINTEDVYFQISEPESLRYTFRARSSRIGVPFTKTIANIALVLAEPRDACTSIINKLEIKDNIALVERGGCSFLEKCIEIERSGGIGVIVYDYDRHNDENYIEMVDDNTSRNCSIPAVSLLGKDGHMIVQSLLALKLGRAVITIPVDTAIDKESNPPWLIW